MDAPRTRVVRRPVHGVLLLDKPLGLSSNQALQKCKWLLRAEKAGHTGTLDPLATGVLPLCFGAATKFSQLHLDADKRYEAIVRLGITTTTGDAEGDVLQERPVGDISLQQLTDVTRRFSGPLRQLPPMYSALKKDGRALYDYARAGETVDREPREVVVRALSLQPINHEGFPSLRLVATVSKGTYIRTLGEDIGDALGCGGHLVRLRRTQTGPFTLQDCVTLDALEAMEAPQRLAALRPAQTLLDDHEPVRLAADDAARFLSGLRRRGHWADRPQVAVYGPAPGAAAAPPVLLGTAHVRAGELIPGRLLSPLEIQQILSTQEAPIP
jgi:tRNA pseudouridine55 synthase